MSSWLSHVDADVLIRFSLRLFAALLLLFLGVWGVRRVVRVAVLALEHTKVDATLIGFLRNLMHGGLIVLLAVMALGVLGVPSAPMVAALGTAGLAIGLALQGSLSNLAWGVLLITFRPFQVGDFVTVADIDGTVESINLMHTWLLLADGREAAVPNAKVGSAVLTNYNRRGTRRFQLTLRIGYKDDLATAVDEIWQALRSDPRILQDPSPTVWNHELGENAVHLLVRAWSSVDDFWDLQSDLLGAIKHRFDAIGISMPLPQRTLIWASMAPGAPSPPYPPGT